MFPSFQSSERTYVCHKIYLSGLLHRPKAAQHNLELNDDVNANLLTFRWLSNNKDCLLDNVSSENTFFAFSCQRFSMFTQQCFKNKFLFMEKTEMLKKMQFVCQTTS